MLAVVVLMTAADKASPFWAYYNMVILTYLLTYLF